MNNGKQTYKLLEELNNLIKKNKETKLKEIQYINKFSTMYKNIREYEHPIYNYDKIITDYDLRIGFLVNSIKVTFENQKIDPYTRDNMLEMYENIYDYLYKQSELIEIPADLVTNIFNKTHIPDNSELMLILRLLRENKRIFDEEIDGKYFSQTIKQGLHKGITKELKIEEKNLSHLLGLTNEGSLYAFYRKTFLNTTILSMLGSLGVNSFQDKNFDKEKFNTLFKAKFGLDYNHENCIKIINWKYNAENDYLKKRGINVTEEERIILNETCEYTPKSNTINFYCGSFSEYLIEKENNEIRDFIYDYIRNLIVQGSTTKRDLNELKKIFSKEELDQILDPYNTKSIKHLIDKYLKSGKYKLETDEIFKTKFKTKFYYPYPLINYNEVLSKNISFYNFTLLKNLNSLIVDYDSKEKKIKSNVFLVSYSKNQFTNIKQQISKIIDEKNQKYEKAIRGELLDNKLDNNYIMRAKSLLSFPEDKRYYFSLGFLSKDKQNQDDKIIKENTKTSHNITLIGFIPQSDNEKERLKHLESRGINRNKHYLSCETNITSNYYQYITDYTRTGIEYHIDILDERTANPSNQKTKILKIEKPLDRLSECIALFELYTDNINEYEKEFTNIKELKQYINKLIEDYRIMTDLKIRIMQYRLETRSINEKEIQQYRLNLEKEISTAIEMNQYFDQYQEYIENKINIYNQTLETNHRKK